MKNPMLITAIAAVLALGAGFFVGMKYQQSQAAPAGQMLTRSGNFGGRGGAGANGNSVIRGDIVSVDSNSITVKARDGSTRIILYSTSTVISKSAAGSASDLTAGESVMAFGKANPDGSITAQDISLNPVFGAGQGPRNQ